MSLYRVKEKLQNATKNIQEPNSAKIYTEDNSLYLITNGIFFSLTILYKGNIYIEDKLNYLFTLDYKVNKLTIINSFRTEAPEILFDYTGDFEIIGCEMLTYHGNYIKPEFKNNSKQSIVQHQKTNIEDDTLIIRDEVLQEKFSKTGKKKINIEDFLNNVNILNILNLNFTERLDKDQLSTQISKPFKTSERSTKPRKVKIKDPLTKKTPRKIKTKGGY